MSDPAEEAETVTLTAMTDTVPVVPWWKVRENWTALATVLSLVLTAFGYTLSTVDMQTLVVASGGVATGVIQIVGIVQRVLASKKV